LESCSEDADTRRQAWDVLVAAYYKPAYKHLRVRWNKAPDAAEDLTQAFFERAMEKDFFRSYDRDKTRFRTFVRVCLDRFVQNADKAARRLKRGGALRSTHLDFYAAESELESAGASAFAAPDEVFDREWTRHLVAASVDALRVRFEDGKQTQFQLFERYDLCAPEERATYAELGRAFDLSTTTVTNQLASARRQFRVIVLEKLRELTASDEEYRSEAERLLGVGPP
jgi:RNA polymerase sigma factor (sigma-70 family)